MCGGDEGVTLPRRCDIRAPATALATHIMQLALKATILQLRGCERALSQVMLSGLPHSALVKVQVDAWA